MGPEIRTVGVIGAGTMGVGIAQLALEAGHDVLLQDLDATVLAAAPGRIRDGLARRAARLDLDADAIDDWVVGRAGSLRPLAALEDLASGADLVIEAAVEDLGVKRSIFRVVDRVAAPDAILTTNTSALSVAAIAEATSRPTRVLGLHFFNPAPLMPLVEVVATAATDAAVVDVVAALMERWGRVPVRTADAPGFIVNRVNRAFTLEPLAALEAGEASIEAIDAAVRAAGYPMGPFELIDLIGLDVNLAVSRALFAASVAAGDPLSDRFRPSDLQAALVATGRLGRKTGAGFYESAGMDGSVAPETRGPAARVVERMELAVIDEAYRTLGDHVASAADIDLAMRLGAGHPVGPFERVVAIGGPEVVLEALGRLADRGPRFVPAPALLDATRP